MTKITRSTNVGIYDNCMDVARIYPDRTVATIAGIRWVGNTGGYHEYKHRIDGDAHKKILAAMADGAEDTIWDIIYAATRDY